MGFQTSDDAASLCNGAYGPPPSHNYPVQSPTLSYPGVDTDLPAAGSTPQLPGSRASKFGQYPYPVQTINRDTTWAQNVPQTSSSSGKFNSTVNLVIPDITYQGLPR